MEEWWVAKCISEFVSDEMWNDSCIMNSCKWYILLVDIIYCFRTSSTEMRAQLQNENAFGQLYCQE